MEPKPGLPTCAQPKKTHSPNQHLCQTPTISYVCVCTRVCLGGGTQQYSSLLFALHSRVTLGGTWRSDEVWGSNPGLPCTRQVP